MSFKRIVIKIGSSILAPQGKVDKDFLKSITSQVARIVSVSKEVCLVSSGAIICGAEKLGIKMLPSKINELQAMAAVGQGILMEKYRELFSRYKILCGQILLTWDDFQTRHRYINAKETILSLFRKKVVPIVNENDTVSTQEICFGDNDRLSALVAGLISADILIILSDVEGFYFKGKLLREIDKIVEELFEEARGKKACFTKGGMSSKLEAMQIVNEFGIRGVIAHGRKRDVLLRIIINKEAVGTNFLPKGRLPARKRWIAYSRKVQGRLIIDAGASEAIRKRGSSLLSQGIIRVEGNFAEKDTVELLNEEGKSLGWGLVEYSSQALKKNLGRKLSREVIHRDNLVLRGG